MSTIKKEALVGATVAGGAYRLTAWLRGGPDRGMYRGVDAASGVAVLVTVTAAQRAGHQALSARLGYVLEGVPRLLHIGPLDAAAGHDSVGEREPRGAPATELVLPLDAAVAVGLAGALIDVDERAHAAGVVLAHFHPELLYLEHGLRQRLLVGGLTPRPDAFAASAGTAAMHAPPMFTRSYQAPEVLGLAEPVPASDVFALCALLAEWVTGQHPFQGETLAAQVVSVGVGRRRPWSGPPSLRSLVDRGLARVPGERPSLAELRAGLDALTRGAAN